MLRAAVFVAAWRLTCTFRTTRKSHNVAGGMLNHDTEDAEVAALAAGIGYSTQPRVSQHLRGDLETRNEFCEEAFIEALEKLPETGVEVDDHQSTPIGSGDSIGLVGAYVTMDKGQIEKLPLAFRSGLFRPCNSGGCQTWPALLRVSHTNAFDVDFMRFALKMDVPWFGPVDLHFTETMKAFPIADASQLQAFCYQTKYGIARTMLRHPVGITKALANGVSLANEFKPDTLKFDAMSKDYYSMSPFLIGGGSSTPGAIKFRMVPSRRLAHPKPSAETKELNQLMRAGLVSRVSGEDITYYLEIQVATNSSKHPVDDISVVWDEVTAPWVRMATVQIPKQRFPVNARVGNVIGELLWEGGSPKFNTKEFLFGPGNNPHAPVGDVGSIRANLYPRYDKARQIYLLGKSGGMPAKCPLFQ